MEKENVIGVMTSHKVENGVKTNQLCVTCLVSKKIDVKRLNKKDMIPKMLSSTPTDVIQVGEIKALGLEGEKDDTVDRRTKLRPCPMGTSGGHVDVSAGTNGELLLIDGSLCIGTNNHVAALSNEAEIGDPYLQPGTYDGGKYPDDVIGHLYKFEPINLYGIESLCPFAKMVTSSCNFIAKLFGRKTRLNAIYTNNIGNLVDAAAVKVEYEEDVASYILNIGAPSGTDKARIGMMVQKSGRTSYHTQEAEITSVDASINVQYGDGKMALFENQIFISKPGFSAAGDSGSLILDSENNAIGKLFAGSEEVTIANHIDDYLRALDATLVIH